jgi:hypothetical protein
MNSNQMKTIRELEDSRRPDDSPEAQAMAKREDELEQGTALLANIYFTKTNMETLSRRGSRICHITGHEIDDPPEEQANAQFELLQEAVKRKQASWWKSLDGIFEYTNYIEPLPEESVH